MRRRPAPTTRAEIARLIYRVALDDRELQLRYRGRTIDVVLTDTTKEPKWADIHPSISDQRTPEEKYRSGSWVLSPLTKLEHNTVKQRALSELQERWKRAQKRRPHKDQLALPF